MLTPFSIIIPTYNRKAFVVEAIESVLAQDYSNFELIVVDDASTDGSFEHLRSKFQKSVRLFRFDENRGVSAARNFGAQNASHDWLCFLDSDDLWSPHKLRKTAELIQQSPEINWIHCQESWQRDGKSVKQPAKYRKQAGWIFESSLELCSVGASCVAINKKVFDGFDESFPVCEDFDLWLKLASQYPIALCDEELVVKRAGHKGQLSMGEELLDPWRLRSLLSLYEYPKLDWLQRNQVIDAALKRVEILIKGALKREEQLEFSRWVSLRSCLENSFILPDGRALNIIKGQSSC